MARLTFTIPDDRREALHRAAARLEVSDAAVARRAVGFALAHPQEVFSFAPAEIAGQRVACRTRTTR